jgi:protein-tyrosine phosphatase
MIKVLFVCMGNICRSPTAEGVFSKLVEERGLVDRVSVDSAGTHAYHIGKPPDVRSARAAAERGIDLSHQRARRVTVQDFQQFDYVLAMDSDNYSHLAAMCPEGCEYKLRLFLSFAPHLEAREVPDPYYGGITGFERVLDMVEEAARGLLEEVEANLAQTVR